MIDCSGNPLTKDERQNLRHHVSEVLNGLERLATGAILGVYDRRVLKAIGGTIIARHWERLQPYVQERQTSSNKDIRQERAYIQLETLVAILQLSESKARIRENENGVDKKRLTALSG